MNHHCSKLLFVNDHLNVDYLTLFYEHDLHTILCSRRCKGTIAIDNSLTSY
jgi:hypothetical protein